MEALKDPDHTRVVKSLPPPPHKPLQTSQMYKNEVINWKLIKSFLKRQGRIAQKDFITLIQKAEKILRSQANIICTNDPITVVGDIHGQFYDFLKLLQPDVGGDPQGTKYLFLGDYVDRGSFSVQVLILILALKIYSPKSVILLRGNHQCRQLTSHFNFRTQCIKKYDQQMYQRIMDLFDCLPLACIINNRFLCIHGGVSDQIKSIDDIAKINRFRQIPKTGLFCDLMWADPVDNKSGDLQTLVQANSARGCSYYFGKTLTKQFYQKNKIISIIRAHQAQADGFKMHKWFGQQKFPTVITLFSAPNYCDFYNNRGAVMKLANNAINIQQFTQSPHPYLLPNNLDLFGWSIPFVIEKVGQILFHLIKPNTIYPETEVPIEFLDKRKILQQFLSMQQSKIQQNIELVNLDGQCPDDKLLQTGKFKFGKKQKFDDKKLIDSLNQSRPLQRETMQEIIERI